VLAAALPVAELELDEREGALGLPEYVRVAAPLRGCRQCIDQPCGASCAHTAHDHRDGELDMQRQADASWIGRLRGQHLVAREVLGR